MKVAVVGVTGMVGQVMCKVLDEMNFPVEQFIPVASQKSVGNTVKFQGQDYTVVGMEDGIAMQPDIALFSAGESVSLEWAPKFAAVGTKVIDNSSAWRMDENVPLVVPEINASAISANDQIIANPNCSTIQMVMALAPLHRRYGIERLVISTYQSITGTGAKAVRQYKAEVSGNEVEDPAYPYQIYENCLPHCDIFMDNGYTREEMKLVHETRKILEDPSIAITATAVRVPVYGGHSESVNVAFKNSFELDEVKRLLSETNGIVLQDDVHSNTYPTPLTAFDKNEVFVGRIRRDESHKNALNMWIVADNLRKGAATNAVQIARHLIGQESTLISGQSMSNGRLI